MKYGQIFRPEYAAYTSGKYQQPGAASLCEISDASTSTRIINRRQTVCLPVEDCDLPQVYPVMDENGDKDDGKGDTDGNVGDSIPKQTSETMGEEDIPPPPTPQINEIILEVCSPKSTNHVTPDITTESCSESDSVST